jgi:hypothetical protein
MILDDAFASLSRRKRGSKIGFAVQRVSNKRSYTPVDNTRVEGLRPVGDGCRWDGQLARAWGGPGGARCRFVPMTGNLSEELTRLCTIPEPAMFSETMGILRDRGRTRPVHSATPGPPAHPPGYWTGGHPPGAGRLGTLQICRSKIPSS